WDFAPALLSLFQEIFPSSFSLFFGFGFRFGSGRVWPAGCRCLAVILGFCETNMNIGGVVFPLVQQSRDEESVVYHGQYDTEGVPHTKSGDRQPVQVSIEFNKAGTFETVWQAKYYNYYKREHCQFGNKFSSVEYECKPNETRTLMWINKEVFN
uniref:CB1 cannabinoid receptor-interacting protein 1 n=1 Tax=Oryzias sinensis TaxID=183150 RepID=A0A8C7YA33_9TELE